MSQKEDDDGDGADEDDDDDDRLLMPLVGNVIASTRHFNAASSFIIFAALPLGYCSQPNGNVRLCMLVEALSQQCVVCVCESVRREREREHERALLDSV